MLQFFLSLPVLYLNKNYFFAVESTLIATESVLTTAWSEGFAADAESVTSTFGSSIITLLSEDSFFFEQLTKTAIPNNTNTDFFIILNLFLRKNKRKFSKHVFNHSNFYGKYFLNNLFL